MIHAYQRAGGPESSCPGENSITRVAISHPFYQERESSQRLLDHVVILILSIDSSLISHRFIAAQTAGELIAATNWRIDSNWRVKISASDYVSSLDVVYAARAFSYPLAALVFSALLHVEPLQDLRRQELELLLP